MVGCLRTTPKISCPVSPPANTLSAWMTSPHFAEDRPCPQRLSRLLYQPHSTPLPSVLELQSNTNRSSSLISQQVCSSSISCLHLITPWLSQGRGHHKLLFSHLELLDLQRAAGWPGKHHGAEVQVPALCRTATKLRAQAGSC